MKTEVLTITRPLIHYNGYDKVLNYTFTFYQDENGLYILDDTFMDIHIVSNSYQEAIAELFENLQLIINLYIAVPVQTLTPEAIQLHKQFKSLLSQPNFIFEETEDTINEFV